MAYSHPRFRAVVNMKKINLNDPPIIKLVSCMIVDAYKAGKEELSFSFESPPKLIVDDEEVMPDVDLMKKIINRLKIMSRLNPMKYFEPTDGKIIVHIGGKPIDINTRFLDTKENQSCWLKIKK